VVLLATTTTQPVVVWGLALLPCPLHCAAEDPRNAS
jgi:hypothetical protein